jgi:moderate conductance mechanosensitive channel
MTIAPLVKNIFKYATYFGAMVITLGIVNIDPGPILASAGILGVAVGFGAQNLIEDIVSGFLILFENYYLVGDYIEAGRMEERSIKGIVEAIELRTTQVRHPDGQLQIIRNGEIGSVINYSKQYIYAKVDIPLAYETSLEDAYSTVEEVGQKLQLEYSDIVIKPTQIEGLESFGKSLVLIRTITKVKPGHHLHIQRVLRRMLKDAFDQSSIELSDYEPETNSD